MIDTYSKYPHAEKLKALDRLECGFRVDAANLGVLEKDINEATKRLFAKQTGDVE